MSDGPSRLGAPITGKMSDLPATIVWRAAAATALVAAAFRSGNLGAGLPSLVWYALQFGPPLVVGLVQAVMWLRAPRAYPLARRDWLVVGGAGALTALAGLSAVWSDIGMQSLRQAGLLLVVVFFLVTTYVVRWTRPPVLRGDLLTLFWTGTLIQAFGLVGYLTGQPWSYGDFYRLVGVTSNANYTGMLSAVLVALSFAFTSLAVRLGALIPLLALVLSDSRGSAIGLILGLLVLVVTVRSVRGPGAQRLWLAGTVVGVPVLMWLRPGAVREWFRMLETTAPPPASLPGVPGVPEVVVDRTTGADVTSGRLDIYRGYLQAWQEQPWLGHGYRSPQVALDGHPYEAHNVYLSVLVELGVVGAALFVALLIFLALAAHRGTLLIAAVVTVLAVELTESSLFGLGGPAALASWVVLFGFAATGRTERRSPLTESPARGRTDEAGSHELH